MAAIKDGAPFGARDASCRSQLDALAGEFAACRTAFTAIGDETRQQIVLALLSSDCRGIRVGEITKMTNLSRPAVSHHVRILKEAGIIGLRRVGTMNFYFIDYSVSELSKLEALFAHIRALVETDPECGAGE